MKWNSVRNVGSSLVSWIVSKPKLALIILLTLLLSVSVISAKISRDRALIEAGETIKAEKKALEKREKENKESYEKRLKSILKERDRLRGRLADLSRVREEIKPPADVNEMLSRFGELGY